MKNKGGKLAFEAHAKVMGRVRKNGTLMTSFKSLSAKDRRAWQAAAMAVAFELFSDIGLPVEMPNKPWEPITLLQ